MTEHEVRTTDTVAGPVTFRSATVRGAWPLSAVERADAEPTMDDRVIAAANALPAPTEDERGMGTIYARLRDAGVTDATARPATVRTARPGLGEGLGRLIPTHLTDPSSADDVMRAVARGPELRAAVANAIRGGKRRARVKTVLCADSACSTAVLEVWRTTLGQVVESRPSGLCADLSYDGVAEGECTRHGKHLVLLTWVAEQVADETRLRVRSSTKFIR